MEALVGWHSIPRRNETPATAVPRGAPIAGKIGAETEPEPHAFLTPQRMPAVSGLARFCSA